MDWFIYLPNLRIMAQPWRIDMQSHQAEAEAYLRNPILGSRLRLSPQLVMLVEGLSVEQIFGAPDA